MTITPEHWLSDATREEIAGGSVMDVRRCLVIHFTGGASARSSIDHMRANGLSAHIVIERDGTVYQCRPFNRTCAHAGKSRWRDPKTGIRYGGANSYSIGIELANAGDYMALATKQSDLPLVHAVHQSGGRMLYWEAFPRSQYEVCRAIAKLLVERYKLDDITGHDCIAPERKNDPGPAFSNFMRDMRERCGFTGLPAVHKA
jgi:N-acetylmuramoyl-L-alanine amidase